MKKLFMADIPQHTNVVTKLHKEGVKVTKHTHPKKKVKNLFMADTPKYTNTIVLSV